MSGFKIWSFGEQVDSDPFNQYVASQVVARFTDSTQRSTQLAGPEVGQLTTLDSHPGALYTWNGSAWVEVGRPALTGPDLYTQCGQAVFTTSAIGEFSVVFTDHGGVNFAAPPVALFCQGMGASTELAVYVSVLTDLVYAYGFVANARSQTGDLIVSAPVRVSWLAIGARAPI